WRPSRSIAPRNNTLMKHPDRVPFSPTVRSLPRSLAPCISIVLALGGAARAQAQAVPLGDAKLGRVLFQQSCALCHATGLSGMPPGGQGPVLAGVVGRPAGSVPSFGYTKALIASHITWDAA